MSVDERVEGASGKPPWLILLDVDQVNHAAPVVRPLLESHGGVAIFDGFDQVPNEIDAVRTVGTVAEASVDLHGDRLVPLCSSARRVGRKGGGSGPADPRGYPDPGTAELIPKMCLEALRDA